MILLLLSLVVSFSEAASPRAILNLSLMESGDYLDKDGCLANDSGQKSWTWSHEESQCRYDDKVAIELVPFRRRFGGFTVSVDKKGKADITYSYGDADATTRVGFWLPKKKGNYPPINFGGGEHASGAWQAEGVVRTEIP